MSPDILGTISFSRYTPPLLIPRSKRGWFAYMSLNAIVFIAGCLFWRYLQTGDFFSLEFPGWRQCFSPSLDRPFLQPLNMFISPWEFLVLGVMLGILITIPLQIAVMYHVWIAALFALTVGVIAFMPILGIILAGGCLLAARTPLRRDYPAFAIMFGLLPAWIYLFVAYQATDTSLLEPIERWLVFMPVAVAFLFSVASAEIAVFFARWRKFKPGVIWPTLSLIPVAIGLFFSLVGDANMQFAKINQLAYRETGVFAPADPGFWIPKKFVSKDKFKVREKIIETFVARRKKLQAQCLRYVDRYPKNKFAPSALWMLATSHSCQLDMNKLSAGVVSPSTNFASEDSKQYWQNLIKNYPASPEAVLAKYNLAKLYIKQAHKSADPCQKIIAAHKLLIIARKKLRNTIVRETQRNQIVLEKKIANNMFQPQRNFPRARIYQQTLSEIKILIWMLDNNHALDSKTDAVAISRLLSINSNQANYREDLKKLAATPAVKKSKLYNNIKLLYVNSDPNYNSRVAGLIKIAALGEKDIDASLQANYLLGRISLQLSQIQRKNYKLHAPIYYYKVIEKAKLNPWLDAANRQIKMLELNSAISPVSIKFYHDRKIKKSA